mgnify:CR=1 FL=1
MLNAVIQIAFAMIALAMVLSLYRMVRGPDATDRILALDTLNINAIMLLVLHGMYTRTQVHFEAALVIAMLGFTGTVVLTKFVLRRDIIE